MKVQITKRKRIEAKGEWFDVLLTETVVRVRTPFGWVYINRVRKGLEVTVNTENSEQFLDVQHFDAKPKHHFDAKWHRVALREFGSVTLGDMSDDKELNDAVMEHYRAKGDVK